MGTRLGRSGRSPHPCGAEGRANPMTTVRLNCERVPPKGAGRAIPPWWVECAPSTMGDEARPVPDYLCHVLSRSGAPAGRTSHGWGHRMATIVAEPFDLDFDPQTTALVIIDMQRDFVLPGGFGEKLGNDTSLLLAAVEPTQRVLAAARDAGMFVVHTREGHRPDLSDCPPAKLTRGGQTFIGTDGPMGRILVRGEVGHDIIQQLYPIDGEPVIDKPGKGSFHATDLQQILGDRGIKTLIVCGVTLEVCVHTTVREANDRGYECIVLSDCVASYFPEFQRVGLDMIKAQGAIFGWVSTSEDFVKAIG